MAHGQGETHLKSQILQYWDEFEELVLAMSPLVNRMYRLGRDKYNAQGTYDVCLCDQEYHIRVGSVFLHINDGFFDITITAVSYYSNRTKMFWSPEGYGRFRQKKTVKRYLEQFKEWLEQD